MRNRRQFILNVVLPVLVVGTLIANPFGVRSKFLHILFPPRANPDRVSESAIDTDGDGQPDLWEINIRSFEPYYCSYTLEDTNHDGTPNELTVVTAGFTCRVFDDDSDRKFDRLNVEMVNRSDEKSRYRYEDLDLDGRFDTMVREYAGETVATYLFMNETLVKAVPLPTYNVKLTWIEGAEGGRQRAVFENGDWHILE